MEPNPYPASFGFGGARSTKSENLRRKGMAGHQVSHGTQQFDLECLKWGDDQITGGKIPITSSTSERSLPESQLEIMNEKSGREHQLKPAKSMEESPIADHQKDRWSNV